MKNPLYILITLVLGLVMGMTIQFDVLKIWANQQAIKAEAKNFTCVVQYNPPDK